MKKNFTVTLILLIVVIFSTRAYAQVDKFLENKEYRNNYISFANIINGKVSLLTTMKESFLKDLTGNNDDITYLKAVLVIPFKNGKRIQQEKYQLYKKGVKFRGGEYLINIIDDTTGFIQGFLAQTSNENFEENYSEQVCVKLAIERFNQSYQITDTTNAMGGIANTSLAIYYYDNARGEYRPAYQVQITSKNSAYSENVFINAATGEFMGAENLVCSVNFPGTAQTQYSGTRNIVTDAPTAAGPYRLQQTRSANNVLIRTRNMNNQTDLSNVTEFLDNDNNWTAAEHGVDRAALGCALGRRNGI